MNLDLTDQETAALTKELHEIVENDRYPFSPRIRTLRAILAKLRPEPAREPLPPPKVYAPPSKGRYKAAGNGWNHNLPSSALSMPVPTRPA
jgi:hypothetical protein